MAEMKKAAAQPAAGGAEVVPLRTIMRRALGTGTGPVVQVDLPDLPPMTAPKVPHPGRDAGLPKLADLGKKPKLILLIGPGGSGKTMVARTLVAEWTEAGLLPQCLIAAADPGPRALARFLPAGGVNQPETMDPAEGVAFLREVVAEVEGDNPPPLTLVDCGGGNTSLQALLEGDPDLFARLEAKGVAVQTWWFFTPRVLDLTVMNAFRKRGWTGTASVVVLNTAKAARGWQSFEPLRNQSGYQDALKAGAFEFWLPALSEDAALATENRGLAFDKVGGEAPELAAAVSEWRAGVRDELKPVESWVK